ncbi:MAG TPA: FkbM family methyltransferase [Bryobacteraceae bacterium]|nr:FkbM family methyltransferase [Bryobacteraceae bacterium]
MKIDVEGAEGRVLAAATVVLSRHRPILCCELHGREAAIEVQAILDGQGYEMRTLEGAPFVASDWRAPGQAHVICRPPSRLAAP